MDGHICVYLKYSVLLLFVLLTIGHPFTRSPDIVVNKIALYMISMLYT